MNLVSMVKTVPGYARFHEFYPRKFMGVTSNHSVMTRVLVAQWFCQEPGNTKVHCRIYPRIY